MRKSIGRLVALLVLVVAMLACNLPTPTPAPTAVPAEVVPTEVPPTQPPPASPTPPMNVRGPGFAAYPRISAKLPPAYEGYGLPVDVGTLGNVGDFAFSDAQAALLAQNGFVVAPGEWLEFFQLYENARYREIPVFVTTDSVYHVYHLLFDKMLRDLEREHFEPDIRALTAACLQSAQDLHTELEGTELGRAVGYAVRDDNRSGTDTRILYATPGVVVRWLAAGRLPTYDTVIID